jgi:hypothetical protein
MHRTIAFLIRSLAGKTPLLATFLLTALSIPTSQAQQAPTSPLPRTVEGKPDLSGFWQTLNSANWNIEDHRAEKGIPAGRGIVVGGEIPYQPWALAKRKENFTNRDKTDPQNQSLSQGVPRINYTPFPFQIVQTPKETVILYEYVHTVRHLYTNGAQHPPGHIDWWLGDSRARWEDDTFVVDVTDFNDQTWFDHAGNFHSDALHVVERYKLTDADHIDYEATIEDPKVFTKPWTLKLVLYRHKEQGFQLLDYEGYGFQYEKYYP